jgi:zinc protease
MWEPNGSQKLLKYSLIMLTVVLWVGIGFGRSPALAITPRHYTDLELPPAPELTIPAYSQFELSNGMRVYLLEDHELPLVSGSAMIRTGSRLEPSEKTGLASIVGDVMRSGGTLVHPADELNQLLEQRAAAVETSIDVANGSAGFSALSEDLPDVMQLFAEVLRQPAFPSDRIELVKNQWRGSIARRNDDSGEIANREFQKLIYGGDSPYARTVEYSTLDNIARADVLNFYRQTIQPQNVLLGITGDFDSATIRPLIEQAFGDWQAPEDIQTQLVSARTTSVQEVAQVRQGGVFLVDQPQLTQSNVQMGHLGGQLNQEGYPALSVMNEVLNGLGGKLVNEVRSRQGLAYSVYALWSPRFDYPGLFIGGGQTRSEATVPFIQSTKEQIQAIRTTPVSEEQLNRAKNSVLNGFIFNFQTPSQVLARVMRYDYYGYPQDFIFQYQRAVEATTTDDVLRAAQANLKPENLVTLVVGNAAQINPPLTSLSPNTEVTQIDVSISPPPG